MRAGSGNMVGYLTFYRLFLPQKRSFLIKWINNVQKLCLKPHSPTQQHNKCLPQKKTNKQKTPKSRLKIKMSSNSFQDVYNHVCRICQPIKHERHYPHQLPRPHWNTLTFRASRRTEFSQSLQ